MVTLEKIKGNIERLSKKEFKELKEWIIKKDWENWDKEIKEHSEKGMLDFLIDEAIEEKKQNRLTEL